MQADTHSLKGVWQIDSRALRWMASTKKVKKQSSQSAKEKKLYCILWFSDRKQLFHIPTISHHFTWKVETTVPQQSFHPPWHASNYHLWNPRQLAKVSTTPSDMEAEFWKPADIPIKCIWNLRNFAIQGNSHDLHLAIHEGLKEVQQLWELLLSPNLQCGMRMRESCNSRVRRLKENMAKKSTVMLSTYSAGGTGTIVFHAAPCSAPGVFIKRYITMISHAEMWHPAAYAWSEFKSTKKG